jgi:hypothetical protein
MKREGLDAWPKLTGGKGIHLMTPLDEPMLHDWHIASLVANAPSRRSRSRSLHPVSIGKAQRPDNPQLFAQRGRLLLAPTRREQVAGSDANGFMVQCLYIESVASRSAIPTPGAVTWPSNLFTRNGRSIVNASGLEECAYRRSDREAMT